MPHTLLQKPYRGGNLQLAKSGHARQLVIFGHGGWKDKDGSTTVPPISTIYYYVADGVATIGHSLFKDIIENPGLAFLGSLNKPAEMSLAEATAAMQNNPNADPLALMQKTKVLSQPVKEKGKGGQSTSNYAVYTHSSGSSSLQKCLNGEIDDDIDVAINESSHKCHLSDFFEMCQSNCIGYQVVHYVACRSSR